MFEGLKKCGRIGYITISIPPEEISAKMMRRKPYNLNAISHDAAIRMVQTIIDKGVHIAKVCVSLGPAVASLAVSWCGPLCAVGLTSGVTRPGARTQVFVDTVGDPGRYQEKLTRVFENRVEFKVAKKADSLYPVVSAASICAKVRAWGTRSLQLCVRLPHFAACGCVRSRATRASATGSSLSRD